VDTDGILMWIYEVKFSVQIKLFAVKYLWVLFVGEGVKRRPRHFIREHIGLERIRENERDVHSTKACITNDETSHRILKECYVNSS
jgi:hypothetical protein